MNTQYRMLEAGEMIQEGDEWKRPSDWHPVRDSIGGDLAKVFVGK